MPGATGPVLEPTLTIKELAAQLHVAVQTLYDLRSQGRGPRGFRVGRHLRFRVSEIKTWLAGLEAEDARACQDAQDVREARDGRGGTS
ncbi:helix-turn-helix domain-containing protein [Nocardioides sp. NPDC047086]|uniref:helix-turn-helix transcriptional regulator n=1 Tax=Nocardioides sp. NPDC047086 TaxID=3154810 RepID=UPI0033E23AEF